MGPVEILLVVLVLALIAWGLNKVVKHYINYARRE